MTAEHFLSAYVSAVGPASLFWQRHDQCVALWRHERGVVELVRYWELERISGLKHHVWPFFTAEHRTKLFRELLRTEGLSMDDVGDIWGLPDVGDSTGIEKLAREHQVSVHSIGHLFSCLFLDASVYREGSIVALAIDGGPDFVLEDRVPPYWYAGAVVCQGELHIRPVESPGLIYTAAVMVFGQEPGTLMAATSVCACRAHIPCLADDVLGTSTFYGAKDNGWKTATRLVTKAVHEARELRDAGVIGNCGEDRVTPDEHVRTVVMRRLQEIAEEIAVRGVRVLLDEFDVDPRTAHLGMSGGSALNCPTNSRLMREFGFRSLLCPPCANDGGQALGLGLAGLYARGVVPTADFSWPGPYLGPPDTGLREARNEHAAAIVDVAEFSADQFVTDLEAGPIAWVDGASEVGPRALGHRSLLGDPRDPGTKDRLNEIKDRQWWRPVAPVVLEDQAGEWFDGARRSPYMLEVFEVTGARRDSVPAVVHLDGTARAQTLAESDDPRLYAAISAFAGRTGVPMLCNTSLNGKSEPIIQTASQAIVFCLSRGVDVLYVDGTRLALTTGGASVSVTGPRPRTADLFTGQEAARDVLWRQLEEAGVGVELMALVGRAPQLAGVLGDEKARSKLLAVARRSSRADPAWLAYLDHLRTAFGPGGTFEGVFAGNKGSEESLMPIVSDWMQQ